MTVEIAGPLPALPTSVVHDLRMIAQEAVTNALKHAQAQHIILRLSADDEAVTLSIIDDGRGFDPQQESKARPDTSAAWASASVAERSELMSSG